MLFVENLKGKTGSMIKIPKKVLVDNNLKQGDKVRVSLEHYDKACMVCGTSDFHRKYAKFRNEVLMEKMICDKCVQGLGMTIAAIEEQAKLDQEEEIEKHVVNCEQCLNIRTINNNVPESVKKENEERILKHYLETPDKKQTEQ